jgi:GT2 family glycosyltransferase
MGWSRSRRAHLKIALAVAAACLRPKWRRSPGCPIPRDRPRGVSVVIPSRNGKGLLERHLPAIVEDSPSEILIVDNGSDDHTAGWLECRWPAVRVIVSGEPLSFACAVNRGIVEARFSHVCLLNNDMQIEPGFFAALRAPFDRVPDLFCATAQIHFPKGARREETGKAVMAQSNPQDFPIRCDEPVPGEDGTWVLYGSGGCSLYDAAKLAMLGNVDEIYSPAYVEDLDLGYRAWLRGWPSIYVAGAIVEHRHRATTSRYYTKDQLDEVLEINYLRFLARAVVDQHLFLRLWKQAVHRRPTWQAWRIALEGGEFIQPDFSEEAFLALTSGLAAIFPGQGRGGAALVSTQELAPPPTELLKEFRELVMIRAPKNSLAYRTAQDLTSRQHHQTSELELSV